MWVFCKIPGSGNFPGSSGQPGVCDGEVCAQGRRLCVFLALSSGDTLETLETALPEGRLHRLLGKIAACGVDVDVAEHFAYETLHLSNAGIAQAVAGFVTDIWMHEPPPQDTFADQTRLLHHACRAYVFHIAQGSNAKDRRLPHCPINVIVR